MSERWNFIVKQTTLKPDRLLDSVPSWVEDETLYSWCSRWHSLSMNRTRTTGIALFGSPSAAKVWNAPNPFGHFDRVTDGMLGSPRSILKKRTVAGSYLPLAHLTARGRVEAGELPPAHLFSAKSGIESALRYCEQCVRKSLESQEAAIWRVTHQLPGVAICLEHAKPLSQQLGCQQLWAQPFSIVARKFTVISRHELEALIRVGEAALKIFRSGSLDAEELRRRAVAAICEAYSALNAKRLDPEIVDRDWENSALCRWCRRAMPEATAFPRHWITDFMRGRRSERNPLKWAFMVAYLECQFWTSNEAFFAQQDPVASGQMTLWTDLEGVPSDVQRVFERAKNMTEAAKLLGVTAPTVSKWTRANLGLAKIAQQWTSRR